MSTTTNIGLEILTEGQANKEASISEAHQQLDALVQAAVIDRDLTSPPGSPSEGDVYLIPAGSAGGGWAGQEGNIAHLRNGAWQFITPREGWRLYVKDEDVFIIHDGSNWSAIGGSVTVKESDGSPSVSEVTTIAVTNGKLTDDGGGQVTLDLSGGGAVAGYLGLWEQIDRVEFSGASSVTVGGNQTPGDYDLYRLLVLNLIPSVDGANIEVNPSADGGSSKLTNLQEAGWFQNEGGTGNLSSSSNNTYFNIVAHDTSNTNRPSTQDILVYAPDSSKWKAYSQKLTQPNDANNSLLSRHYMGWIEDTNAIDSFVVEPDSGTISGIIILLGLKKSDVNGRLIEEATAARTLSADDNNRVIHFTAGGSSVAITLPSSLPEGFCCRVINETGGALTLSGSGGLTILGDTSLSQYRAAEISRIKNNKASVVVL